MRTRIAAIVAGLLAVTTAGCASESVEGKWKVRNWGHSATLPYSSILIIEDKQATFEDSYTDCSVTLHLGLEYSGDRAAQAYLIAPSTKVQCTPHPCELLDIATQYKIGTCPEQFSARLPVPYRFEATSTQQLDVLTPFFPNIAFVYTRVP